MSVVLTLTLDVPFNHLYVIYFMLITSFNFPEIPQPASPPPHSIKCFLYLFSWCFRKLVLPKGHFPMELLGVGATHLSCSVYHRSSKFQLSCMLSGNHSLSFLFIIIYWHFGYSLMPIKALASCSQLSPQTWDLLF